VTIVTQPVSRLLTNTIHILFNEYDTSFSRTLDHSSPDKMVKCQLCKTKGHAASACPSRTRATKRRRCQLCDQVGHTASDCPQGDVQSEADSTSSSSSTSSNNSAVSACAVCDAPPNIECAGSCQGAGSRNARIEEKEEDGSSDDDVSEGEGTATTTPPPPAKTRKPSKGAAAAAKTARTSSVAVVAAVSAARTVITPEKILKMRQEDIARLEVGRIVMLPETWRAWVWSRDVASRPSAYEKLLKAVQQLTGHERLITGGVPDSDKIQPQDARRAEEHFEELKMLLDPAGGISLAAMGAKVANSIRLRGQDLRAFISAKKEGWPIVRKAQDLEKGLRLVEKSWTSSLDKAKRLDAGNASPPSSPGAKTKNKRRSGKGKKGGKGAAGGGDGDSKSGNGGTKPGTGGGRR
jgi:hypothetical protein